MPTSYDQRLQERLPAQPGSIGRLRRAIVAYAGEHGASERCREDIAVAVSEALSNAVLHAYVGRDQPGDVGVRVWVDDRQLQVVVQDDGIGMAPRADSPGMGLGLALIGRMTEHLELASGDGTAVRMTFLLD